MLKKLILSALAASGLALASVPAHAHGYVSFGIAVPGIVVAPAPFYGPRPGPVYVPRPAYAPVVGFGVGYGPAYGYAPGYYYRGWHRGPGGWGGHPYYGHGNYGRWGRR